MKTQPINSKILIFTCLLMTGSVATAGTIAQSPLFVTSSLDPNIMFIIDNSGSMNLSFIPNTLCTWNTDTNLKKLTLEIVATSSTINGLAYNPTTTYTPPMDSAGVSLGNSTFNNAWTNGYVQTGTKTNLSTTGYKPTFSATSAGCDSQPTSVTPTTSSKAFYYAFKSSCNLLTDRYKTTCYQKVDVSTSTAAEQQNFANWYSYYRTRLLTTKSGASRAFSQLDTSPRVGYGQLNNAPTYTEGGVTFNDTIYKGVRAFSGTTSGTPRFDYFNWLFKLTASGMTPSRRAIDTAGRYFSNEKDAGPWTTTPGTAGGTIYTCRQNYTIFMTDGYWNDAAAATADARTNNDGNNGPKIFYPNLVDSYSYSASTPFKDGISNTLADVAMYYWKRDICPSFQNNVPVSPKDPAFWQHMSLYGIGLGVPTQIVPATAFAAITDGTNITWPDPDVDYKTPGASASNPPATRIDDLLHASVNGHGGYFNANDTDQFVNALKSTLTAITDNNKTSASAAAANSTSLQGDTLLYLARFKPGDWYGSLIAYPIIKDPTSATNGAIDIDNPNWEASDRLPLAADRHIFTLDTTTSPSPTGIEFAWTKLNSTQQKALNKASPSATADTFGKYRLDWLRGDDSLEQIPITTPTPTPIPPSPGRIFRARHGKKLGDIVNSDPAFVGNIDYGYSALTVGSEGTDYSSFRSSDSYQKRTPVIYVGANDGMLHAFDARKNTVDITTGGNELFAYVPNYLFPELSKLTNPNYVHQYYVDGNTSVGDAYLGGAWHTMLVGSTGAGGRAFFALDVTTPDSFGASNVMWEFSNANDGDLGYTMAQPSIVRTHDASHPWMVIFGNGYNSDNGHAVLMWLDALTGKPVGKGKIDTGYSGSGSNKNGLSSPLIVDTNGDKIVDVAYAGDLYGNLWKFDLTSTNSSDWNVAYKTGSVNQPLFVACTTAGTSCTDANRQPITGKPNAGPIAADQAGGSMIYFGTGKYFETGDDTVSGSPQTQTFYGIWDNNAPVTNRADLQEQKIEWEGTPTTVGGSAKNTQRIISNNAVCYSATSPGCTAATATPPKKGWALNLLEGGTTAKGERVVSYPLVRRGFVIFSTIIPDPDPCTGGGHGWLMEVGAFTGGRTDISPFDANGDGLVNGDDLVTNWGNKTVVTSGIDLGIGLHDTVTVVEDLSVPVDHKYASGSKGAGHAVDWAPPQVKPTPSTTPAPSGRQAWRQLR